MTWRVAGWRPTVLLGWLLAAITPAWAQIQIDQVASAPASPVPLGQPVTFTATANASDGGPLEYRWTFGDGTPRTNWSPANAITHVYQSAGAFTVLVQVRHAGFGLASATLGITVQAPASASVAQSSGIVVHGPRRELWLVNPDHGTVAVIAIASRQLVAEIAVGDTPVAIAIAGNGDVWVANRWSDSLQRIDPATRQVVQTVDLHYGAAPAALVVDPQTGTGYAALSGSGRVLAFDGNTGALGGERDVGPDIGALAINGSIGTLFVARTLSNPSAGQVWRLDLPAMATVDSIVLPMDTTTPDSGTAGRGMPNYVSALSLTGSGTGLWYAGQKANVLRGLRRDGQPLSFETSLRSLVGRIDATALLEVPSGRIDIDDAARLSALTVLPGDSLVAVALEGRNEVVVLDAGSGAIRARAAVNLTPRGLAFDPVERVLYSQNLLGRSITALDAGPLIAGNIGVLPVLADIATATAEPLSPGALLGKIVFHDASDPRMAQDGYFSCAACHLDGGHDGRTWDFSQLGEGLRNTTTLRGRAGLGQGRVHWTGNFDEIQDFEHPIRALFGGIGFLSPAQFAATSPLGPPKAGLSLELDALADYLATLDRHDRSPYRDADGSLTADGLAGRQHFTTLQCQLCHSGAGFSDSPTGLRHDVGSLTADSGQRLGRPLHALDTPTLRGLWQTAPYLHDGRAADLEAVLVSTNNGNGNGPHGDVARLTAIERQQLIRYLLQIDDAEPAMPPGRQLTVTGPASGSDVTAGSQVDLAIQTNLSGIVRVVYRASDTVIAISTTAPYGSIWEVPDTLMGTIEIEAHVTHNGGRFNTLSLPATITVVRADDGIFADGFQ